MVNSELIINLLDALLENGYYDPTEKYASNNAELLLQLSSHNPVFSGEFLFKFKRLSLYGLLHIDSESSMLKIITPLTLDGTMRFKQAVITNFLRKYTSPTISINEENNILFEYELFYPTSVEQFINVISNLAQLVEKFYDEYKQLSNNERIKSCQ